jgi:hypothetical protein
MPRNLILAYIATWLIHGSYIVYLMTRSRKARSGGDKAKS